MSERTSKSERKIDKDTYIKPTEIKINWQKLLMVSFRKVFPQLRYVRYLLRLSFQKNRCELRTTNSRLGLTLFILG